MEGAVVLLPPSEGKAGGGDTRWRPGAGAFRGLASPRQQVIAALAGAPQSVLGVRGDLLERALRARDALVGGRARALPAWARYTGVVWEHLGPLDEAEWRRVLVPSGLLGLSVATDPIPDYRLKMSVSLPGLGRLASWWRHEVSRAVARYAGGRLVVDLLPAEHAAAIDWARVGRVGRVLRVRFEDAGGAAVGHNAKAAKGALARAVLLGGADEAVGFRWQGWAARVEGDDVVVATQSPGLSMARAPRP